MLQGWRPIALVDWVEIRLILDSPSQPRHVKNALPEAWRHGFVEPTGHARHLTDTQFSFRVQDPAGPESIRLGLEDYGQASGKRWTCEVVAVEIALDFHPDPEMPSTGSQEEFLARALQSLASLPEGPRRVARKLISDSGASWTSYSAVATGPSLRSELREGWTVHMGKLDADVRVRAYIKRRDSIDGRSYAPLPVEQCRPRIERTFRGSQVPFRTLEEWGSFDFCALQRWFAFRRNVSEASPEVWRERIWLDKPVDERRRRHHKRVTLHGTRADARAYELVRQALRRLTTAQRKPVRVGVSRGTPVPEATGNSGDPAATRRGSPEGTKLSAPRPPEYLK